MKNTVQTWRQAKQDGVKIAMLTAYDYSTAKLEDEAGINGILVGDSLGNVILGYEDTLSVTMEDMIHHGAAVSRGAKNALVMIDMPFMSYQTSVYDAVVNAGRLMKEGRGIYADPCSMLRATVLLLSHIGATEEAAKLERALDFCMFEDKKYVITGRDTGTTCEQFAQYVIDNL